MNFDEYVVARRAGWVRAVVLLGCPQPDAEDVVQTALLKVHRAWSKVRRADQPDAYAYRVLVNTLNDARSRRWTGELPTEVLPDAPLPADDLITGLAVRRALLAMSQHHREVLVLRFYADLSERDTAEVLGIAAGTVKSRTSRALATLAEDPSLRSTDDIT